jgi:putative SOS response-associated peptidase YedK
VCGRYVSATPIEEIAAYFHAEPDPDLADVARPRYNVPPTELVLGVVEEAPKRADQVAGEDDTVGHAREPARAGRELARAGHEAARVGLERAPRSRGPGVGGREAAPGAQEPGGGAREPGGGAREPGGGGPETAPDGNAAVSRDAAAERAERDDGGAERRIRAYRWGLVPPWAKDVSIGNRAFNARAESVATKPAFRAAFRTRRLLVPATAFYEWRRGAGGRKQPFAFRRADGAPLAFAGLWERWRDPESGVWLRSLTIITADAGPDVAPVHNRQPVVVEPQDFERWLATGTGGDSASIADLRRLLAPSPAGTLVAHPVDPAVGNTANDAPRLFDPVEG